MDVRVSIQEKFAFPCDALFVLYLPNPVFLFHFLLLDVSGLLVLVSNLLNIL
jgi:hypothetical protein